MALLFCITVLLVARLLALSAFVPISVTSKEVGLEVNAVKTVYMLMSHYQKAEHKYSE
jgi:hypothetical protein